jgi:antitoxin ParD1/3/4
MPTRNIVLTEQQSDFIDTLVAGGRFQNASEALRAGLRLLEKEEAAWDEVKRGVLEGLAQVQRGEFAEGTGEEVFRRAWAAGKARAARE